MSKIFKAIRDAKDSHVTEKLGKATAAAEIAGDQAHAPAVNADTLLPSLAASAKYAALDQDLLDRNRVILNQSESPGAASYKMLRTRILQQMRANNWHSIAVASARRNAGKTLTLINTAISLSSEPNQKVILVDLDLRNPTLAETLGLETGRGLSDYFRGTADITEVVVRTDFDRLLILPNYERIAESSEMLSSSKMLDLVRIVTAKMNSTIVLFDLPPLLETDDLLAFSPLVDALLLVISEGETRRADLEKSAELIHDKNILGFVLNKSRNEDEVTGYYY
jgi:protein-tyrosine kinase